MTSYRLNRLFRSDSGRTLIVAIDHALFNNSAFLDGIEDMEKSVQRVAQANPEGVLVSPGEARHLQSIPGRDKPALMLRIDVANFYNDKLPASHLFCETYEHAVEMAIRLDAACILVNLFQIEGHPEVTRDCIRNIVKLKSDCDRYGMPLGMEPLTFKPVGDSYVGDTNPLQVCTLTRTAVELGADLIKTDPTDPEDQFGRVVEIARGIPVTVRGGSRASDEEVLAHAEKLMKNGCAGMIYGRNIIQHQNPVGMTRALGAVIHKNATAAEALKLIA